MRIGIGLFGAPVAWITQVFLSEPLAAYACYPYRMPLSAPIWERLPVMLVAIGIACFTVALLSGLVAWRLWRQFDSNSVGEEGSYINNTVNLSNTKPSPAGEGWVTTARMQKVEQRREQLPRGNQNKGKSLFKSPHPSLIMPDYPVRHPAGECKSAPGGFVPEGEGAQALKSTVSSVTEAGEGRNRFLVRLGAMSSFIFIVATLFNMCAVLLVQPCSAWV
ncbi:MAG: hypothetical protein PHD39_13775 [Methylobacter tundripaludum]|nr:hypothetical protein [Methylobacter tundripaludum]